MYFTYGLVYVCVYINAMQLFYRIQKAFLVVSLQALPTNNLAVPPS